MDSGFVEAFQPLLVSIVAMLPLIIGAIVLIAIIRRRERRGRRR